MKTRSQFWHLLENELAPGRSGNAEAAASVTFLLAVYWAAIAALPWLILFGDADGRGNVSTLLQSGLLPILWLLFLSFLTLWMSYVIIPEFRNILPPGGCALPGIQHAGALEFLFTRPANRRLIFRTRTAALAIMVLGPLFFDMGASFFAQKLFSFIHAPAVPRQIVPYAVWLTWSCALTFLLFQAYGISIAKWVKSGQWWTGLFPFVPVSVIIAVSLLTAIGPWKTNRSFCESSFALFAAHPLAMTAGAAALAVVIETWSERKFSQFEIF